MAEPTQKKPGLLRGLIRTLSRSQGNGRSKNERLGDPETLPPRHRPERRPEPPSSGPGVESGTRRRPRRPNPKDVKGKGPEEPNGSRDYYELAPLTEWPPSGFSSKDELPLGHAMELISRGVPAHKGYRRTVTHASESYYALFATTAGNRDEESDSVNQHESMTQLMSLRIQGSGPPTYPWETLEQPSFAFGIGCRPGTITLNAWVNKASKLPPEISLRDPGVRPREVGLEQIFQRLKELEHGLEDDDEGQMYKGLYKRFLRDPEKTLSPHKRMEQQIMDLVMCLSSPDWIDFTNPRNQVVTKFIYDTEPENHAQYHKFFYQLLLSMELEQRINSRLHIDKAKERLMGQIPPKIQWNLALARRWRDNVRVEAYGDTADDIRLRFKLRKRQGRMLKRFAQMMKWPNLGATEDSLKERDREGSLVTVSSAAMAFFSGLVLPGPTFPFLIMNSLIDIDPDQATDHLALLTHMSPNCGFQYRQGYTYWTSTSIVGKVLAPTCREIAGWIGPARPSTDLAGSQIARIRSRKLLELMTSEDVTTMSDRSDPLGPAAEVYPIKEYELFTPDIDDVVDTVRVEKLNLRLVPTSDSRQDVTTAATATAGRTGGPTLFDAEIQFAIDGVSWPFRLQYDVCFIHAWPCSDGPHPLFFDYVFESIKVDQIMEVKHWGRLQKLRMLSGNGNGSGSVNLRSGMSTPINGGMGKLPPPRPPKVSFADPEPDADTDIEKVLIVEAFGVKDNEVLARAWCAHWGLSAVVVDIGKTCMACGIREAYAATLTVVILVEDLTDGMDA
ncbi:hypothetical protein F5Y16DRAFT_377353 [Xylariaceae sp. FL0255]|nr:hypothetical protein F5Y16DRAFT_377353 [Xylariaceae sp. FL0255]